MEDIEEEVELSPEDKWPKKIKLKIDESKSGVVYLSKIPTFMSVKKLRQMFEQYGEIGRIFLQPDGL